MESQTANTEQHWFVLRDFKKWNAIAPAYKELPKSGIRCFTPMHWIVVERNGKRKKVYVPVIQNLLFAYSSRDALDPIIERNDSLQYQYARGGGRANPMLVPDLDMERFIKAVESDPSPKYFSPEELMPDMIGREILVNDGPLAGLKGRLLKIQGSKKRRLIVAVEGYIVAAVEVNPDFIQFT